MILPTLIVVALGYIAWNMKKANDPPNAYISNLYDSGFSHQFDESVWAHPQMNYQDRPADPYHQPNQLEYIYNAGMNEWHLDQINLPEIAKGISGAGFYPSGLRENNISIVSEPQ